MANLKHMNNEMAVSPIVATLVLIVVAVIGAVAVGTIMGTFSTDVSKQANTNQANAAVQNEILVAGSTTIDPITQAAAKLYTAANPDTKIVSQAIASGAGIQAVGNGVADIGATSDGVSAANLQQFPNLQPVQIGMGAIVIITNKAAPAVSGYATFQDLTNAFVAGSYGSGNLSAGTVTVLRADSSGTAKTFYVNFLGQSKQLTTTTSGVNVTAVNGNQLVVSTVGSTPYALGFADYGDAVNGAAASGANNIAIVPYQDSLGVTYTLPTDFATSAHVTQNWNALRGEAKAIYSATVEAPTTMDQTSSTFKYSNISMIRALWYVTNGAPNSNVANFIQYVRASPQDPTLKMGIFQETNNFGMADIA